MRRPAGSVAVLPCLWIPSNQYVIAPVACSATVSDTGVVSLQTLRICKGRMFTRFECEVAPFSVAARLSTTELWPCCPFVPRLLRGDVGFWPGGLVHYGRAWTPRLFRVSLCVGVPVVFLTRDSHRPAVSMLFCIKWRLLVCSVDFVGSVLFLPDCLCNGAVLFC